MKSNLRRAMCAVFAAFFLFVILSGTVTAAASGENDPVQTIDAEPEEKDDGVSSKAIAAAAVVGLAATAGAIGMGIAIAKSAESMARQPEASDKINSAMMLGLVFIETMCIYALITAILIIFVL